MRAYRLKQAITFYLFAFVVFGFLHITWTILAHFLGIGRGY